MNRKLSTKAMFKDICTQRSRLKMLNKELANYSSLVGYILENDFYYDNLRFPSIKDLANSIGISSGIITRQIKHIYEMLCDEEINMRHPFVIMDTDVSFYIKGDNENSIRFRVKGLSNIPRKGETVEIPFFNEYLGQYHFYVSEVYNTILDNNYDISVHLKAGRYNSYWELRKDQAFETEELSFWDYFRNNHELKKKLNIRQGNAW